MGIDYERDSRKSSLESGISVVSGTSAASKKLKMATYRLKRDAATIKKFELLEKKNLMEELKKMVRVIRKQIPDAPHEVLLVLDATTGQNAIFQAREFRAAADLTGLVITKLDGTAKGGVVIGIVNEFDIPVRYIGIGERIDDLRPFGLEVSLSLVRREPFGMYEPAEDDRGAAPATRFTMDIHGFATVNIVRHEMHCLVDRVRGRSCEIDRRNPKLLDAVLFVLAQRSGVFFACINDGPHTLSVQFFHEVPERQCPQDEVIVHKGRAEDTIAPFLSDRTELSFSFVYVDVDLYEPTKRLLAEFHPRMMPGSVFVQGGYALRYSLT